MASLSQLSVDEVVTLLRSEKIISEKGITLIEENEINGKALLLLDTEDRLKEIGLKALGDRVNLRDFITKYRTKSVTPGPVPAALTDPDHPLSEQSRHQEIEDPVIIYSENEAWDATETPSSARLDKAIFHLTFNVIVSGHSWGWDDSSELYIVLHPQELGGMSVCQRWTTQTQYADNGLYAVKGTLQMPFHFVKKYKFIYYKYAAKARQTNGLQFEHILTSKKWNGCRCLDIPDSQKKQGGVWEQWDTIVFPKESEHGVSEGLENTNRQITNIDLENQEIVAARCLGVYLNSYQIKLQTCDIISASFGISQMVYNVVLIFNQLKKRLIGYESRTGDRMYYSHKDWSSQKLNSAMELWAMSIVRTLLTKLDECTDERYANGSSLVSAITVLCIVFHTNTLNQLSEENCSAAACLLRESYMPDKGICPAYAALNKHLPTTEFRNDVVKPAIKELAVTIIVKSNEKNLKWLYVIPLYHFMAGLSSPYEPIPLDKEIKWRFWKELDSVRKKQQSNSFMYIMMTVMDLMELDYSFTKVMLYMCPYQCLVAVLQKVDPILATSFYIWYVENHGKEFLKAKDNVEAVDQHLKALNVAHMRLPDEDWMHQRKYSILRNNAYTIMRGVLDALTGTSENQCQILHHLIDYVIFVISEKFKKQHGDEATVCLEKLENDWPAKAVELIGQWLQKVIEFVKFGGAQLKKFGDEVHVWKVLFISKDSSCSCTQMFWEYWITAIEQLLERRIKPVENKAKLVSCLESKEGIPHQVCEVIIRLATDDLMSSAVSDVELSIKIDDLATQRQSSGNVGKLFSRILTRHLEKLTKKKNAAVLKKSITVKELIEWKVWSSMVRVASDEQIELFCRMTEFAKEACKTARNTLQVHCDQVAAGAVTLYDMRILKQNERTADQLCTAASIREFSLQNWLGRLENIERYIERVQHFHNLLHEGVQGYESLKEELRIVSIKPMNELYFHWNDPDDCNLSFTCCPTIKPCTLAILGSFYLLATSGRKEVFCRIWNANMTSLMSRRNCVFTQEDIVRFVWKPTFEYCVELVTRLEHGGIMLNEVERVFCDDKKLTDLQLSCESLVKSLVSCSSTEHSTFRFCTCECCTTFKIQQFFIHDTSVKISSDMGWIQTVRKQIEHYRLSKKCIECAKAILTLCDENHLNLKVAGDFSSVFVLGEKDSSKLAEFNLRDVTDSFVGDIQVLDAISDESKVECLKSLLNHWKLVKWIKKFQSVKGLHAFVEVALDTTDDDMTITLLSDLRTVGNAVGKLLFHLPEQCGLNDFVTACGVLWEGSFHYKLLEECSRSRIFLKNLKVTQGCLERKTIDEIKIINEFGQIIIGKASSKIYLTPPEVITVKVISGPNHPSKEYTFQELQDLISRIILITGKGKAENQTGLMQKFLEIFRNAIQIAERLIRMHQEGFMKSLGDCYCYRCVSLTAKELSKKARDMETELKEWTEIAENARDKYYPLNSFTNKQLCLLRKELYNPQKLTSEVKFLFTALLPCTSGSDIIKAIRETWQQPLNFPTTVSDATVSTQSSPSFTPKGAPPLSDKSEKTLELKQLVESSALTQSERDLFMNMTEQGTIPLVTLLVILRNRGKAELKLNRMIVQYEDIRLGPWMQSAKFEDICKEINELLSERAAKFLLKEKEDKATTSNENISRPIVVSKSSASIIDLPQPSGNYLTLEQLGKLLQGVVNRNHLEGRHVQKKRYFQGIDFEEGYPNLVVTSSELVLTCTLMLYAEGNEMPLPTQEEVLICTPQTTAEEVILLWRRAINDPGFKRIFCLAHAEKLSYVASEECTRKLMKIKQGKHGAHNESSVVRRQERDTHTHLIKIPNLHMMDVLLKIDWMMADAARYRLVVICSKEEDRHCRMAENLHAYLRTTPNVLSDESLQSVKRYMYNKYQNPKCTQIGVPSLKSENAFGWKADIQESYVRVVTSSRAGMGKSLYITRRAEHLTHMYEVADPLVSIHVNGPKIAEESIMDQLQQLEANRSNQPLVVHFDIAPSMVKAVDCFLFSIFVLGCFTDQRGKLWRRTHNHLYMIELTQPQQEETATQRLLQFLPFKTCQAPVSDALVPREDCLDQKKWLSDSYQIVYHYLKQYNRDAGSLDSLKRFNDAGSTKRNRNTDFLQHIFSHYRTKHNPSWRELEQFISFLSVQLFAFEKSAFCKTGDMSTYLPGMRSLVLRMMIHMSKEFTMPSLRDDMPARSETHWQEEVATYRWKKWSESYHPYLLFNQDEDSFTFFGFFVNKNGHATDPVSNSVIMNHIMSPDLRNILIANRIDMSENCHKWERETQLKKLASVLGLDYWKLTDLKPEPPKEVKSKTAKSNPRPTNDSKNVSGSKNDPESTTDSEIEPRSTPVDPNYVLTYDNVIKILAIVLRFRCRIPVVIMGETGCGKTRLLRFVCNLLSHPNISDNFIPVKIHGGTTEDTIIKAVLKAEEHAIKNVNKPHQLGTILFFDEANTTEYIDLIKEIMCDRTLNGRKIHSDVRVVAACNPYRVHSKKMIKKLESAGLGFHVRATETREILASGCIPLRHLVYRVHDLPPSMKSLVYDFGQLDTATEQKYTVKIVEKHLCDTVEFVTRKDESQWKYVTNVVKGFLGRAIADILNVSQDFMRKTKDECSYVSLRDVDRAMIVIKFFIDKSDVIGSEMKKLFKQDSIFIECKITRAVVLALSVCYYARLQGPLKRSQYVDAVSPAFKPPLIPMTSHVFVDHVLRCQEAFLNNMREVGQNIAHNRALCENVMMMVVCANVKIPLFLIGKPGSSKSLAKTIVNNSMRGSGFLENFQEIQMFSYQCSQLSTSESILNVFRQAETIQSKKDRNKFVSVVVLDEVGLAEDSPGLPLKVLHPLLEDGTEGSSYSVDVIDREDRVAFIGISNWALDPAKMNRGIMVTRCDPDERELTESAKEICSGDKVADWLKPCFKYFATVYLDIIKKQSGKAEEIRKEFFGLRDFYSLVKMLYWICKEAECGPYKTQIKHAVLRNFSGYDGFDPWEMFEQSPLNNFLPVPNKPDKKQEWRVKLLDAFKDDENAHEQLKRKFLQLNREKKIQEKALLQLFHKQLKRGKFLNEEIQRCFEADSESYFQQKFEGKIWPLIEPDCSPAGLIKASLANKERSYHGQNRYLLFLTESYAALQTLQHFFEVNYQQNTEPHGLTSKSSATVEQQPPLIIFGSSFSKDRQITQVYRNINTIKICMETGRTVILLNLYEEYESLYDVLNQYYREYGAETRFVDLGLQTHRIKCRVHNDFKLIIIAEKKEVYDRFPTPLINRLEKHIVDTSTVLNERQKKVLIAFKGWIERFNDVPNYEFQPSDSFVGYQPDTPSAIVFTASKMSSAQLLDSKSVEWEKEVLNLCKSLLLEMASPDALIRLINTPLVEEQTMLCQIYMKEQHHVSLEDFVQCHISTTKGVLMQATTHNQLLSEGEAKVLGETLESRVVLCSLQEFDTEFSYTTRVREKYRELDNDVNDVLLIVQCDSGHLNGDLLACAKYRLDDIIEEESTRIYQLEQPDAPMSPGLEVQISQPSRKPKGHFHVLFTVYLPRKHGNSKSSFVCFHGGEWICTHIDDFFPVQPFSPVSLAFNDHEKLLSELFRKIYIEPPSCDTPGVRATAQQVEQKEQANLKLYVHIQQAVEKAGHLPIGITAERMKRLNQVLLKLLRLEFNKEFYAVLVGYIHSSLKKKEEDDIKMKNWIFEEATNSLHLQHGGSFMNVILRRLESETADVLSGVIAAIDTNYNLELLVCNGPPVLSDFWIEAFKHKIISDILEQHSVTKGSRLTLCQSSFVCTFPFSVFFQDSIETQLRIKLSNSNFEIKPAEFFEDLVCEMKNIQTCLWDLLKTIPEEHHVLMGRRYLTDLVNALLPSLLKHGSLREKEAQIVLATLEPEACQLIHKETPTFLEIVVAFHIAYHRRKNEISRLKKLVKFTAPTKINSIAKRVALQTDSKDSTDAWKPQNDAWKLGPDVLAVRETLQQLCLGSELEPNQRSLITLMRRYYGVKQLVHQVLYSRKKTQEGIDELRLDWQKLQVVYKFIEHVILENTAENPALLAYLVPYAKRLNYKFTEDSDFELVCTTNLLEKTLREMYLDLEQGFRQQMEQIKRSCITFYTEVISSLFFGQAGPPDDQLVERLLKTVFTVSESEESGTEDLTPFMKSSDGDISVIRSFLLQLLFRDSSDNVCKLIEKFFCETRQKCDSESNTFRSVTYLYCQCFEDSLYQRLSTMSKKEEFSYVYKVMEESYDSLVNYYVNNTQPVINRQLLEAIGGLRFALKFAADCISLMISPTSPVLTWSEDEVERLLKQIEKSCIHKLLECEDHRPKIFLFKLLFRRHGATVVEFCTTRQPDLEWLVSDLKDVPDFETVDHFAIHNPYYGEIRAAVVNVLKTKEILKMPAASSTAGPLLIFSLLSHNCRQYCVSGSAMDCLESYINTSGVLSQVLKPVALAVLHNAFCGPLPYLAFKEDQSLQNRLISSLMVHIVTVILSQQDHHLLQPYVCMMLKTESLKGMFMPAMPDSLMANTSVHLGGKFLACPSGHICYVYHNIEEFGVPLEQHSCHDCGRTIQSGGSKEQKRGDTRGYTLGEPLPYKPSSVRSLSPVAAIVMRVLMHAVLLWTTCNKDDDIKNIRSAIHPSVSEDFDVQTFFYKHLQEDLKALGDFLTINDYDVILLIHLIAKYILKPIDTLSEASPGELFIERSRNAWEQDFSTAYILPVIQNIPNQIAEARMQILNDRDQMQVSDSVNPYMKERSPSPIGDLWAFRPQLTLEHISQSLRAHDGALQKHSLLVYFLKEEPMIRATQHLPSILQLQQYLLKMHHHRSNHEDLKDQKISQMITDAGNDRSKQIKEMVESTRKAWSLVKGRIFAQGFLKLSNECLDVTFSDEDSVELLLPRPSGQGVFSYALVAHLVYAHNEFVDKCSEIVKRPSGYEWRHAHQWWKQTVCLEDLQSSDLILYEDKLMSIIMAHCHHVLKEREDVSYKFDFQGLEKQFLNECVYGKPHIEVKEMPHMVYRKNVYTAQKLEEIKRKVPQVALTSDIKKKIITHVKEPHQLRVALDHIDIVLGFLAASTGVKPQTTLKDYAQNTLKIEDFDDLIGTSCRLQHMLSLWETVSLELAKQFTINGEKPFCEVKECFRKPFEGQMVKKLNEVLQQISVDTLLNTLNLFISTHIRNVSEEEADESLVERLVTMYAEMAELKDRKFPEDIKLCHVVSVWQHVVKYDQDLLRKTTK